MYLFYEPDFATNGNKLSPEESKHCVRVLRHQAGDIINIMDGKGSMYKARIVDANAKTCTLCVEETITAQPRSFAIHVALAPTKNIDRLEWFLEKATEIGIEEITPLLCEHSERKAIKPDRLEKVIVAAAKQSLKSYIPKLNNFVTVKEFLQKDNNDTLFIAHCKDTPKQLLKTACPNDANVTLMIGPEGDFSTAEIALAEAKGYTTISLGKERLRTETAALMACATVNFVNQ